MFKLTALLAQLVATRPISPWKKHGAVLAAISAVVLTFSLVNIMGITKSELYRDLHEKVSGGADGSGSPGSYLIARLIRGAINAQSALQFLCAA